MATRGRRFRDAAYPTLEYGEPEDDQIAIPSIFAQGGEGQFRPRRQNVAGSEWDFMTGAVDDSVAGANPTIIPVGPQPQQPQRGGVFPGAAGPGGGGGPGRGQGAPASPFGLPEDSGLDVNEYLAQQRGRTFQDIQGWDAARDAEFVRSTLVQNEIGRRARLYGANMLNPIVAARVRAEVLGDPNVQRQYQREALGYDPRFNRMLLPAGFDPATDPGFLQASANYGQRRQAARGTALEGIYGPAYDRRRRLAELAGALDFFGGNV